MTTLQCNTNGDIRFSPQFCFVKIFGKRDSIENHYQKTKRYIKDGEILVPQDWRDVVEYKEKGYEFSHFELPVGLTLCYNHSNESPIEEYYTILWYKFLLRNQHLVEYAASFTNFQSGLEHKHPYTHAQIIRDAASHGLQYLKKKTEGTAYLIALYLKESENK